MHNHAALASLMESVQDALAVSARAAATLLIVIIFLFIQQTLVQLIFLLRVIADVFSLIILDVLVGLFCLVAGIARVLVLPVFSLNSFE